MTAVTPSAMTQNSISPTSSIRIAWAPSQSTRRPISRRRSCQPPSGSMVAKWFAASCPTFDAVVHAPYGKKISHSLIPPGYIASIPGAGWDVWFS